MESDLLSAFVENLRATRPDPDDVPGFDLGNGNLSAKVLLVLEAPGPGAVLSKRVSINNDDPTARNLKELLAKAKLRPEDVMIWNVVPWYCGNVERTKIAVPSAKDVTDGIDSLCTLVGMLRNLKAIVLVGSNARKAHVRLSSKTRARILSCHHMSRRVFNTNERAATDNEDVFAFLGSSVDDA